MPVLSFVELIFVGIFFVLMVVGTALDRRYNESPKWWVLGIGIAIAVAYFWSKTDFSTIWTAVQDWSFWKPLVTYLIAGLVYSVLEFILSVRKMARSHAESWNSFISTKDKVYALTESGESVDGSWVTKKGDKHVIVARSTRGVEVEKDVTVTTIDYREIFKAAQAVDATEDQKAKAAKLFRAYVGRDEYRLSDLKKDFVQVELNSETYQVQPIVNRGRLSAFIGAWTFMWPAYAVSLVLGDFMVEVFRAIGNFFSTLGGRFVKLTFDGVFKV